MDLGCCSRSRRIATFLAAPKDKFGRRRRKALAGARPSRWRTGRFTVLVSVVARCSSSRCRKRLRRRHGSSARPLQSSSRWSATSAMPTAFSGARKNRLDLSVGIALGSASRSRFSLHPYLRELLRRAGADGLHFWPGAVAMMFIRRPSRPRWSQAAPGHSPGSSRRAGIDGLSGFRDDVISVAARRPLKQPVIDTTGRQTRIVYVGRIHKRNQARARAPSKRNRIRLIMVLPSRARSASRTPVSYSARDAPWRPLAVDIAWGIINSICISWIA